MRLVDDVSRRKYLKTYISHWPGFSGGHVVSVHQVHQYKKLVPFQVSLSRACYHGISLVSKKPLGYIYKSVRPLFLCYSVYSWFFSFYFPRKLKLQNHTNSWAYTHCFKLMHISTWRTKCSLKFSVSIINSSFMKSPFSSIFVFIYLLHFLLLSLITHPALLELGTKPCGFLLYVLFPYSFFSFINNSTFQILALIASYLSYHNSFNIVSPELQPVFTPPSFNNENSFKNTIPNWKNKKL